LKNLSKEDFAQALQQKFILRTGGEQTLELSLVAVTHLTLHPVEKGPIRDEPFSLMFHGPVTPWARQHTYRLENETLGEVDIFLVPLGLSGSHMQYEAVFT